MASSNCFNCHEFNTKSLGPSFIEIASRYHGGAAVTDTLTRRIKDGSSGIWGRTGKMPSHPEISTTAIRSTVRWILQATARADHAYFTGISGILHFPANRAGAYTLTATYTDHGPKNQPGTHLKSSDKIIVTLK
jgi:cytochrome c